MLVFVQENKHFLHALGLGGHTRKTGNSGISGESGLPGITGIPGKAFL